MTTIVALSSGSPPAAIAVIRISGPAAHAAAKALAGDLPKPRHAVLRELHDPRDGALLDTALILRFDGPNSATGEDIVEFHCHGGRAVVAAVLDAATSCHQVRSAEPGEFTRRALAAGKIDLMEAEGLADLLAAETEAQRLAALKLSRGELSRHIDRWRQRTVELSARAEAAIDYVGDEWETATDVDELRNLASALRNEIDAWLARPRLEVLKEGIRVVVAGPPNSGKSSLINALIQRDRVIVTDRPGTTRDTIEVPLVADGIALLLVDTAGLRETEDEIEAAGIARSQVEVMSADILLWLGPAEQAPDHSNRVIVRSMADMPDSYRDDSDIAVSAVTHLNLNLLVAKIVTIATTLAPPKGQMALNRRQAVALGEISAGLSDMPDDLLIIASSLRGCLFNFDRLTGKVGIEDALDALFQRFCLGK